MEKWWAICMTFLCFQQLYSQKELTAQQISNSIKIDGLLNESEWSTAEKAMDFIEADPNPGVSSKQQTEVNVLYDNNAIYVGAKMWDSHPDSLLMELSQRDNIGNTDWFGFILDSYKDGINGLGFIVTAAGVQYDVKYSALSDFDLARNILRSGDTNWNAVWDSAVKVNSDHWVVELKIPYSAIRFPSVDAQDWAVNFVRLLRRKRQMSYWTPIDAGTEGVLRQSGSLKGIHEIKPPVRLSATPFLSTYFDNYFDKNAQTKNTWSRSFNAGMDIKYGINDAFTMDMTLIPDFGQVQSDNQVLNLSPFEIRFDENRQFFTEGTELFNKADLFYSRRVGGTPINFDGVDDLLLDGESIKDNPGISQLLNATKISGRTNKGLGIGFFNATGARTYAKVENENGEERSILTNPITNYNVIALDQNLKNNSYVTLINTNVLRNGSYYDANVTGTEFLIQNKANTYSFKGLGALSQKYQTNTTDLGLQYQLVFAKTSGTIQYEVEYEVVSDSYDQSDLGFLLFNNYREVEGEIGYNIFKPIWKFNRANSSFNFSYNRLYDPNVFYDFSLGWECFFFTRKFFAFGLSADLEPITTFDYFEPRTADYSYFYQYPTNFTLGGWISSDYRKKFALDVRTSFRSFNETGRKVFNLFISPRFRVSNKLSFIFSVNTSKQFNDIGYTKTKEESLGFESTEEDIIFGRRDRTEIESLLTAKFTFNNKMGISFRARHYWSKVLYDTHYKLDQEGLLLITDYTGTDPFGNHLHDLNVNIFNIDMIYNWRFAPGSDLFIVWKNQINNFATEIEGRYLDNFGKLVNLPQLNSLSIKMVYYLDYLYFRNKH